MIANIKTRIARAMRRIRDVVEVDADRDALERCSFRDFKEHGAEIVSRLELEPDAHAVAQTLLESILTYDRSIDLDASTIVWKDLWACVQLPTGQHFNPSQITFEIIGQYEYYLQYSAYPPAIEVGNLYLTERKLRRRYQEIRCVRHPTVEIDQTSLRSPAIGALSAREHDGF